MRLAQQRAARAPRRSCSRSSRRGRCRRASRRRSRTGSPAVAPGSMNCGSTASMNTMPLGLVAFTRKPRSSSSRGVAPSRLSLASALDGERRRAPLLHAEPDEVRDAEPLDDRERERRCREHRAESRRDDAKHEQDAEDQAEDVPQRAAEAVAQSRGHARDRARTRRHADQPAGDEERRARSRASRSIVST